MYTALQHSEEFLTLTTESTYHPSVNLAYHSALQLLTLRL